MRLAGSSAYDEVVGLAGGCPTGARRFPGERRGHRSSRWVLIGNRSELTITGLAIHEYYFVHRVQVGRLDNGP